MPRRRTRRRSRRKRGGSRRTGITLLVALLVVALILTPSGAFTSSTVPRGAGVDGVSDANGIMGLAVPSQVSVSSTEQLVNVTNNRASSVDVTVTLDPGAADVGDLVVDGVNQGDSATFSLASGALQTVEISVPSDCSLGGRSIPFDVSGTSAHFSFTADRSSQVAETISARESVVYERASDSTLSLIDRDGQITNLGVTTQGFGPISADYDCDGHNEVPYVNGNEGISLVDVNGETQELVSGSVKRDIVLGVGDFDGDGKPAVVFPYSTNDTLHRVEFGGSPAQIGGGFNGHSVAGVADFNGDGDSDIIYTWDKALRYIDGGTSQDTGVEPSNLNNIGAPMDFDGDGQARVPVVDKNSDLIVLVDSAGNTQTVSSSYDAAMGSLGSFDWNNDGQPDILSYNDNDGNVYFLQLDGTNTAITDSGGNNVQATRYGVA